MAQLLYGIGQCTIIRNCRDATDLTSMVNLADKEDFLTRVERLFFAGTMVSTRALLSRVLGMKQQVLIPQIG